MNIGHSSECSCFSLSVLLSVCVSVCVCVCECEWVVSACTVVAGSRASHWWMKCSTSLGTCVKWHSPAAGFVSVLEEEKMSDWDRGTDSSGKGGSFIYLAVSEGCSPPAEMFCGSLWNSSFSIVKHRRLHPLKSLCLSKKSFPASLRRLRIICQGWWQVCHVKPPISSIKETYYAN